MQFVADGSELAQQVLNETIFLGGHGSIHAGKGFANLPREMFIVKDHQRWEFETANDADNFGEDLVESALDVRFHCGVKFVYLLLRRINVFADGVLQTKAARGCMIPVEHL